MTSSPLTNAFSPSRLALKWMWKPEPPWSLNGLPMNVATSPWIAATSLTAALSRNARSAASSAGAWRRLISYCEFMNSWLAAYVPRPRRESASLISRTTPFGSACGPTV